METICRPVPWALSALTLVRFRPTEVLPVSIRASMPLAAALSRPESARFSVLARKFVSAEPLSTSRFSPS